MNAQSRSYDILKHQFNELTQQLLCAEDEKRAFSETSQRQISVGESAEYVLLKEIEEVRQAIGAQTRLNA